MTVDDAGAKCMDGKVRESPFDEFFPMGLV
jgi:hypothetical protein